MRPADLVCLGQVLGQTANMMSTGRFPKERHPDYICHVAFGNPLLGVCPDDLDADLVELVRIITGRLRGILHRLCSQLSSPARYVLPSSTRNCLKPTRNGAPISKRSF
jgi:hypothetical protein